MSNEAVGMLARLKINVSVTLAYSSVLKTDCGVVCACALFVSNLS
jgi:hypothetical protein